MAIDPQWVAAAASTIGSLSLLLIVWQVKANHDRERRKVALDVMRDMQEVIDKNSFRYMNLMFSLPKADIENIKNGRMIEPEKRIVAPWLPELADSSDSDFVALDVDMVLEIRIAVVRMLNALEAVAIAYKHGVADREILNEAYYPLLIQAGFLRKCQDFMDNYESGAWPALKDLEKLMNPAYQRKPAA
jgi:hypothetical protein